MALISETIDLQVAIQKAMAAWAKDWAEDLNRRTPIQFDKGSPSQAFLAADLAVLAWAARPEGGLGKLA